MDTRALYIEMTPVSDLGLWVPGGVIDQNEEDRR